MPKDTGDWAASFNAPPALSAVHKSFDRSKNSLFSVRLFRYTVHVMILPCVDIYVLIYQGIIKQNDYY
jgi:hypothetical protein